jgi:hypothetical protein
MYRLSSASCAAVAAPNDGNFEYFRLGGRIIEGAAFYAIASNASLLEPDIAHHVAQLPDACARPATRGLTDKGLDLWLDRLDQIMAADRVRLTWAVRHGGS